MIPDTPLNQALHLSSLKDVRSETQTLQSNLETESLPSIISGSQDETDFSRRKTSLSRSKRKSFLLDVDTQELKVTNDHRAGIS